MPSPVVTIIIVNWKTPELLSKCLHSIAKDEKASEFEIIVVDNNSQDGSLEMLRRDFAQVRTIANSENVGFSKACNQVIPESRGQFILLLNPDAVVVDNAVSTLSAYMEKNPKCGACGPKVLNPDGSLQLACRRAFPSLEASFYRVTYLSRLFPKNATFAQYNLTYADPDSLLEVDALSGSCMMVRKSVVDQVGLLDDNIFMFGEDIDWCWRIKQAGWQVFYVPSSVVYHVHGASSRLRPIGSTINLHKGMEVFYRKHLAKRYWAPVNLLVYVAIWLRAAIFIVVNSVKSILKPAPVSASSVSKD